MSVSISFASNALTVQRAGAVNGGLCIYDKGAVVPASNTNPNVMIANSILGNGEDNYRIIFATPVAVGVWHLMSR